MARMSVAQRRAILIDAAIAVMSREGVPNTTTRAIVAEAGMQIGMFHYCFRSKDELVLEVMREINHRSALAVDSAISSLSDPAEIIRSAVIAYWQHIAGNPQEHLLTYELTSYALRQGNQSAAVAQYEYYEETLSETLRKAAEAGRFQWRTPIDVLTQLVLAMVEGLTLQWLVRQDDERARTLMKRLVVLLLHDAGLAGREKPA